MVLKFSSNASCINANFLLLGKVKYTSMPNR